MTTEREELKKEIKEEIRREILAEIFTSPLVEGQDPPFNPILVVVNKTENKYTFLDMSKKHVEKNTNNITNNSGEAPITATAGSGKPNIKVNQENNTKWYILLILLLSYLACGIGIFVYTHGKTNILPEFVSATLNSFIK